MKTSTANTQEKKSRMERSSREQYIIQHIYNKYITTHVTTNMYGESIFEFYSKHDTYYKLFESRDITAYFVAFGPKGAFLNVLAWTYYRRLGLWDIATGVFLFVCLKGGQK